MDDGFTAFRLPRSHYHCVLSNFDWAAAQPKSLHERIDGFLQEIVDGKAPHMLLTGTPGIGKSHLGVAVYRAAASVVGTGLATWLNVPAFCESVKREYGQGGEGSLARWEDYEQARRLVVLDDLFGKELTSHEKDHIVTRLLDTAYSNNAAVLLTMNQSVEELVQRLPAHELSRALAGATVIPMKSTKDWRR